jgi:hypothetical protein
LKGAHPVPKLRKIAAELRYLSAFLQQIATQ